LAYSGGDVEKKTDRINYCQFIGVDKVTGDTIRILSAAIAVEGAAADGKPMFTPSTTYDFDKGIREATLRGPTNDDKMVLGMMPGLQAEKPDPAKLNSGLEGGALKEYVMVPKDVPFFTKHFKTFKGILSFKEQPW
jgi:hypothetical protein